MINPRCIFCLHAFLLIGVLAMSTSGEGDRACPEKCTCSKNYKRISCIGRHLTIIPPDIPTSATELYLSQNNLTSIPSLAFVTLTNLTTLSLMKNTIYTIADRAFLGLANLKFIYLRQNRLRALSADVFADLTSLRYLYLTDNKLTSVPDLKNTPSLIRLTLDNNNLTSATFSSGFRNLTSLSSIVFANNPYLRAVTDDDFSSLDRKSVRSLDFSRCNLTTIGEGVFHFLHLQSLDLSYNANLPLDVLRSVFGYLVGTGVSSLDLSGVITTAALPADFFANLSGVHLTDLNLQHSEWEIIENGTFGFFPTLKLLDLSVSKFTTINDDMSKMTNLTTLRLNKNRSLKEIPKLNLPLLKTLDLSHCTSVFVLDDYIFSGLPNLKTLSLELGSIRLVKKYTFYGLVNLESLNLSSNSIGGNNLPVKVFSPLSKLVHLDISGNVFTQIWSEYNLFRPLQSLRWLDMSGNACANISRIIFRPLTNLEELRLGDNELGKMLVSDVEGLLFANLSRLRNLSLNSNGIDRLAPVVFDGLVSLRRLDLSSNPLTGLDGRTFRSTAGLEVIDLSRDGIATVSEAFIDALPAEVSLDLSANPFECFCGLIWFRRWITSLNESASTRLPGLASYTCSAPPAMADRKLVEFNPDDIHAACFPPPWLWIIVGSSAGGALVILSGFAVVYRYRWSVRLRWFYFTRWTHRIAFGGRSDGYQDLDDNDGHSYDVMVSYGPSDTDRDWVLYKLIPRIDIQDDRMRDDDVEEDGRPAEREDVWNERRRWTVFFEDRDVSPNLPLIGAVATAIYRARKVILVVSTEYLRDGRRYYEMELVIDKMCRAGESIDGIVLVLMESDVDVRLPAVLHPIVRQHQELRWTSNDADGQRTFWLRLDEKLRAPTTPGPVMDDAHITRFPPGGPGLLHV